jgi:hypothetical protein
MHALVAAALPDRSHALGITKLRNRRLSAVAEIFIETARGVAKSTGHAKEPSKGGRAETAV